MTDPTSDIRSKLRSKADSVPKPPQGMPAMRLAAAHSGSLLARLLKKPVSWVRRHERFPCCVVAVMEVVDKAVPVDGLITEVSQGGLLFRPASTFIFDRRGLAISVRFSDEELTGRIVNVKSSGYGILFDTELTAEHVARLLASFGLDTMTEAA